MLQKVSIPEKKKTNKRIKTHEADVAFDMKLIILANMNVKLFS